MTKLKSSAKKLKYNILKLSDQNKSKFKNLEYLQREEIIMRSIIKLGETSNERKG